jgi:hypothetical protein
VSTSHTQDVRTQIVEGKGETMPNGNELLNEKRVAAEIFQGWIGVRTLQMWRCNRRGPKFLKVGRNVVYRRSDVEDYLSRCAITTEVPPALADVLAKAGSE